MRMSPENPTESRHFEPSQMEEGGELDLRWFCLRVAPKQEHVAIAHLRKVYQVEVFCPRLRFQKATRTGRRWYVEALFPSYLFGKFDYLTQHRAVHYCPGVSSIVHFGGKVIPGAFARDSRSAGGGAGGGGGDDHDSARSEVGAGGSGGGGRFRGVTGGGDANDARTATRRRTSGVFGSDVGNGGADRKRVVGGAASDGGGA